MASAGFDALETAVQVKTALTTIGSPPVEESTYKVNGEETDRLVNGVQDSWLYMTALVAIVSAAYAMFLTASTVVDVASLGLLVMAPIAIAQKVRLSKLGSLRSNQNELRTTVNEFSEENSKLKTTLAHLENATFELKEVTQELDTVSKKYGSQTDRLVSIVQENAQLQVKIKKNLEGRVMQQVLRDVLSSDKNLDFKLNRSELQRLKTNLSNIPGITFDKANFDKKIGHKDLSLADIMAMFRNLKEDIPEEENIFHITPAKIVKRGLFGQ